MLFWKVCEPGPSCSVVCGGIIHLLNLQHVLSFLGWKKFTGHGYHCYVKEVDCEAFSCSICGFMSAKTGKVYLLTYRRRWRWPSLVTKKCYLAVESFWYSPRNSSLFCILLLELLHSLNSVREQDGMAESKSVWTEGEQMFWGLLPITPLIAAVVSDLLTVGDWLYCLETASVHTKSVNIPDKCTCTMKVCLP